MNKILFYLINFTWCIIQNIIGGVLFLINIRKSHPKYKGAIVTKWSYGSSVSLGAFIFVSREDTNLIKHEYGHTMQSMILGIFYLLVIGLPSIIWCSCFENYRRKHNISYYTFYTEAWANKLGGINIK